MDRHPDIFCTHAANLAWHILGDVERLDGVRYLRVIGSQGHSHLAAGDVHGVSRHHVPQIREAFGQQFNAAVVIREPFARIRSQIGLFEQYQQREYWDLSDVNQVLATNSVTLPSDSYRCRFFVHAVNMLNAIVEEVNVGRIFRSEDLTRHPDVLGDFIDEITRGKVVASAEWLRSVIETPRINAHSDQASFQFEDWQCEVIQKVVRPKAWELYQALGYLDLDCSIPAMQNGVAA